MNLQLSTKREFIRFPSVQLCATLFLYRCLRVCVCVRFIWVICENAPEVRIYGSALALLIAGVVTVPLYRGQGRK